jgi:hypothetical protein
MKITHMTFESGRRMNHSRRYPTDPAVQYQFPLINWSIKAGGIFFFRIIQNYIALPFIQAGKVQYWDKPAIQVSG